jgi:hypothetical protein
MRHVIKNANTLLLLQLFHQEDFRVVKVQISR